jgi:hypothetical protein
MRQLFRSQFKVTQAFGVNASYYSQFGLKGHEGIDLIPTGTDWEIKCLEDGVVVTDEDNARSGAYGVYVTVWHPTIKKATQYCHMEKNYVNNGQTVKKGDALGKMGSTGNTSGAHVHLNLFEVDDNGVRLNRNNGFLGGINPYPFLEEEEAMVTLTQREVDELRLDRDANHNKWVAETEAHEKTRKKVLELEETIRNKDKRIQELTTQNQTLHEEIVKADEEVNQAIGDKLKTQDLLRECEITIELVCKALSIPLDSKRLQIVESIEALKLPTDEIVKHYESIILKMWDNLFKGKKAKSIVENIKVWISNILK